MAVVGAVIEELRDWGWRCSIDGPDLLVTTDEGIVKLPVNDGGLTPDPQKSDWIAFLMWYADNRAGKPRDVVDVVEKPYHYPQEYACFLVESKLEES